MREIRTDTEVLIHVISDGINVYIRDVLIPRGVVDEEAYHAGGGADDDLVRLKYEVAAAVAARWAVSWRSNEPPGPPS